MTDQSKAAAEVCDLQVVFPQRAPRVGNCRRDKAASGRVTGGVSHTICGGLAAPGSGTPLWARLRGSIRQRRRSPMMKDLQG